MDKTIYIQYCSKKRFHTPKVCIEIETTGHTQESLDVKASILLEHYWKNSDEKWRLGCYIASEVIKDEFTKKMIIRYK